MFFSMVAWQVITLVHSVGNQPRSASRSRSPSHQPAGGGGGEACEDKQVRLAQEAIGTQKERSGDCG